MLNENTSSKTFVLALLLNLPTSAGKGFLKIEANVQ